MQSALEVGVTVWLPWPAAPWEMSCDSVSLRWLVLLWSKGNSYIWAASQLQVPSLFALGQTCPLAEFAVFFPRSPLASCSSSCPFAPLPWHTRLYISVSCFHSFRQKHLLCTCRSRKSDVWIVFPQISRITHIHCRPHWAALPGAAWGSDKSWVHTHWREEKLKPVCARADASY